MLSNSLKAPLIFSILWELLCLKGNIYTFRWDIKAIFQKNFMNKQSNSTFCGLMKYWSQEILVFLYLFRIAPENS